MIGRICSSNSPTWTVVAPRRGAGIGSVGNTSAASVPLALSAALRAEALQPGARVVLGAIGAGLVWGATVVTWGNS